MNLYFRAALTLLLLGVSAGANAVLISASSAVSGPTSATGNGLSGSFADVASVSSGAEYAAARDAADNSPTATFVATTIDYPNGALDVVSDSNTLSTLLGSDASSLSGAGSTQLTGSFFIFEGLINILEVFDTTAGNATIDLIFAVGSDDGFRLYIGNTLVSEFFGNRAFAFTNPIPVEFEAAGLYDIRLEWWENAGVTGIEFYSSIPGGPNSGAPAGGTVGIVPTSVLFHNVPVPATVFLLGLGVVGFAYQRRT